jgi:hypothetical protein
MNDPIIDDSPADDLKQLFASMRQTTSERRQAARDANRLMPELLRCMANKTGQSYKLRALLWSLYNGQPASLIEVLGLDWSLRKALLAVVAAFGFEERGSADSFFYQALKDHISGAGLWHWFTEEGQNQ